MNSIASPINKLPGDGFLGYGRAACDSFTLVSLKKWRIYDKGGKKCDLYFLAVSEFSLGIWLEDRRNQQLNLNRH
jgi:hypothetical protein